MIDKKNKVSQGRRSRRKGHSFEREIAQQIRVVFPEARRQLEYHSDDARGVDLQNTGPYRIQCKRLKRYASITAIQEVVCQEWAGEIPVLVTAGDDQPAMAVLSFEDFLVLLKNSKSS